MKGQARTNQELIKENALLKQRIHDLEKLEAGHKQVEEALQVQEERLRLALASSQQGWFDLDIPSGAVTVSPEYVTMIGYDPAEFQTSLQGWIDGIHSEDRAGVLKVFRECLETGNTCSMEYRRRTKTGEWLWISSTGKVIEFDSEHKPLRMIGTHADITERKRAEYELRESRDQIRMVADHVPALISYIDSDLHYRFANELYAKLEDIPSTEIIGKHLKEIMSEEYYIAQLKDIQTVLSGKEISFEADHFTKKGKQLKLSVTYIPDTDSQGCVKGFYVFAADITERKRADEALKQSEEKFRLSFMTSFDAFYWCTLEEGKILQVNPGFEDVFGYTRDETIGRTALQLGLYYDPADRARMLSELKSKGHIKDLELKGRKKSGEIITVLLSVNKMLINNQGYILGVTKDITERKQAEEALRESEARLQSVLDNTSSVIFLKDLEGRYITVNRRYEELFNVIRKSVVGKSDYDFFPRDHADKFRQHDLLALEKGAPIEVEEIVPQNESLHTYISVKFPLLGADGNPYAICGIATDITERKQAAMKIEQSEQFIRNILDTVDESFIVIDRNYRILKVNKAYCNQYSTNYDDVIGQHCYEISHRVGRHCFEEGEQCAVREVFQTGKPHESLHKHPGSDGQVVYMETKAFPIKDEAGNVMSVIETINNITERYLLEEERLKAQKLESIGTLAGGIAHDFNNLLQGIFGYIAMAKMTFDQKEKSLAMLEQAEKALHQSVNLTTQLLTFSKGGKPVKKSLSLKPVIENAVKFALSGSRTDAQFDIDPALWHVNGDAGQLGQVIQNIVLNADQAMPLGGVVNISARNAATGNITLPPSLAKGNYVKIMIEDNGVGISEQFLDKIFDPYFTTKEKGSGLGLATSYSIIRNHDGQIRVASEVGKGTVFSLYVPAVAEISEIEEAGSTVPIATTKARVLLMDDEELIREFATELLSMLGNEVEVAANGETALAKYKEATEAGRPFDIVILDLTIRGGMGGLETVRKLVEMDPGVKAVVSSGYSDDTAIANYLENGFRAFLKKPYKIPDLQNVLHALLTQ